MGAIKRLILLMGGVCMSTLVFFAQAFADEDLSALGRDKAEIRSTIESFATLADQNAFEYLGRLFAPEVKVDYTSAFGGEPQLVSNRDLMKQWASVLPGFDLTHHELNNIKLAINGNTARVTAGITASHYLGDGLSEEKGFWQISGRYAFELQKQNQQWLIAALTLQAGLESGSRDVLGKAAALAQARLAIRNSQRVDYQSTDTQVIKDALAINNAALWPKPANPVAAGSEESPALKVVQNFFAAYGKGDTEALKSYVADDVEWHIPGRHALAGTKRGVDEFLAFFEQLGQAGFHAEVMILAANDTYVIDAHRGWSTTAGADENIDLNWVLLYQIEDGKIKRVQNFSGDLYASDLFFNHFVDATNNQPDPAKQGGGQRGEKHREQRGEQKK
ncbi:nuclear transport factor 2 family protein [Corallincola platygyrae]|uniref:Nuclear transport factor 2 family protein n=1 Tax=Corallincola platygyrae TaxID=1193278 RepID=A0ABW4XK05_9GAMM